MGLGFPPGPEVGIVDVDSQLSESIGEFLRKHVVGSVSADHGGSGTPARWVRVFFDYRGRK